MTGKYSAEVSVEVPVTPAEVFEYFTDPGRYVSWMGAEARLEPVPGGQYHVRMLDGFEAAGEFVRVDRETFGAEVHERYHTLAHMLATPSRAH